MSEQYWRERCLLITAERDRALAALRRACERIADGPQEYHEAKTAEDWAAQFLQGRAEGSGQ